ncbi:hypothetical protein RhiJN_18085 [Ceratobasidium sp. AG-Ba]|nr:hypothetical protein RhiJN_18085 [Ceratobasidium sp. AG-Ba]
MVGSRKFQAAPPGTNHDSPTAKISNHYNVAAKQSRRLKPSASAVEQILSPSDTNSDSANEEALTEAHHDTNQTRNVRVSRVIAGPAQADSSFDVPPYAPSVCLSCGRPTLDARAAKHPRGKTDLAVQDEQSLDPISTPDHLSVLSSPTDTAPLLGTLNQGGERPLTGPKIDATYLHEEFRKLPNVRFKAVLDFDATFDQVKASITQLWEDANEGSHLMILSTGHGIDNRVHLWGSESIDEQDIQDLVHQLYDKDSKQIQTITIFDICRDIPDKEVPCVGGRISLTWSCSLGQKAGSLVFKSRAPGSFFLNALFRAYQDVCENRPGSPEAHLEARLNQLALYNGYRDHTSEIKPGVPKCPICVRDKVWCPEAFVLREDHKQTVDLSQNRGDIKRLFDFLQREGCDTKLPDGVLAFFSKLELFEERSKYATQMAYLLRNPRDTQAWLGWLSWMVWSMWAYSWLCVLQMSAFRHLSDNSVNEEAPAKAERKRAHCVGQAPLPAARDPSEQSLQPVDSSVSRGAKVSVAAAPEPSSPQP